MAKKQSTKRSTKPKESPAAEKSASWTDKITQAVGGLFKSIDVEYDSLRAFYVKELKDLYSAEHQLLDALPKMAAAANSAGLRTAFEDHLKETEGHVKRLEQVFKSLRMEPEQVKCKAMAGLVAEGSEWINESATPGVKDAGLIAAAQRVEHYEIAGYGCVRTYAQLLGDTKAVALLQATLDEEGSADKKLTQLSKRINVQADAGKGSKSGDKGESKASAKSVDKEESKASGKSADKEESKPSPKAPAKKSTKRASAS